MSSCRLAIADWRLVIGDWRKRLSAKLISYLIQVVSFENSELAMAVHSPVRNRHSANQQSVRVVPLLSEIRGTFPFAVRRRENAR